MVKTNIYIGWIAWLWSILVPGLFLVFPLALNAQFSPPAGRQGSTAIHKDSAVFVGWAVGCTVQRGYIDISRPSLGLASAGSCEDAIGMAGTKGTLSLGDAGYAVLTFDPPIANGRGYDFAVFENAFDDYFLELAFVEVSSDGKNFIRFPNTSLTQTHEQISSFGTLEAEKIHNLAGKYRLFYGVPFDLDTLKHVAGLDVNHITHIRIVDVVGSLNPDYASFDSHGNMVNDPWPTPFHTGGFDLDAIGVIHTAAVTHTSLHADINPNPMGEDGRIRVYMPEKGSLALEIFDIYGRKIYRQTEVFTTEGYHELSLRGLSLRSGTYILRLLSGSQIHTEKFIFNNQL